MLTATGYRVIVKPDPVVKKHGKLILAVDEKMEKTGIQRGVIVSIGPTAWKAFREVSEGKEVNGVRQAQVGDYVLYSRHAGRFVYDPFMSSEDDQNEFIIMNDEDVLVLITKGTTPVPVSEIQHDALKDSNV